MSHIRRAVVLALAALTLPAVLASAAPPFRRQAQVTVEETPTPEGAWSRKIVQPRFEFFTLWPDRGTKGGSEEILLEQVFTFTWRTDQEGMPSTLAVTAWKSGKNGRPGGKTRYDTKLWSFDDEGNEGEIFRYGELYRSTQHGCCASENVQRIYDLRNGMLAAVSTVQPGVVEVPNTPVRRIVAYHSAAGVVGPPEAEDEKLTPRLLGVLTFSARAEVLHRVAVVDAGTGEVRESFSPELILRVDGKDGDVGTEVSLWSAEKNPIPANIRGFRVELTFADHGEVVRIPVENDDFDLANATVPPGLRLVRVK